jgi:hypothetical protein
MITPLTLTTIIITFACDLFILAFLILGEAGIFQSIACSLE